MQKTSGSSVTTYSYGSEGELLSVVLPNLTTIDYVQDPGGQPIAKKVNGVITEKYLWGSLTNLLAVFNSDGSVRMRFEYAGGHVPVAMTSGGQRYYLLCDQVGSLRVVMDVAGAVVKRIDYDSFGNILTDTNPSFDVSIGFAGGFHDRDTGLVRFGYRDYDPDIGRWTAKDPVGFAGGDTNLYAYVNSNPVSFVDPDGRILMLLVEAGGYAFLVATTAWDVANLLDDPCNPYNIAAVALDALGCGVFSKLARLGRELLFAEEAALLAEEVALREAAAAARAAEKAAQMARNAAAGEAFEQAVRKALGAPKNTATVQGLYKGVAGNSVPDILGSALTEIKSGKTVSFGKQLQIQNSYAKANGMAHNLIVGLNTHISAPLLRAIAETGGTIRRFDPLTGVFLPY